MSLRAEIIDRIVAVVETRKIITLSDIRKERDLRAALGEETASDDAILQSLIEQFLKEEQMAESSGIDASSEEIDSVLKRLPNAAGIEPREIRQAVAQRLRWENYRDQRFGRALRTPTNDELQDYYQKFFVPEAQRKGLSPIPSFEQVMASKEDRTQLQKNVIIENMNHEVELWLQTLRRRAGIEIFP